MFSVTGPNADGRANAMFNLARVATRVGICDVRATTYKDYYVLYRYITTPNVENVPQAPVEAYTNRRKNAVLFLLE